MDTSGDQEGVASYPERDRYDGCLAEQRCRFETGDQE
jgi:hypothetical protein